VQAYSKPVAYNNAAAPTPQFRSAE